MGEEMESLSKNQTWELVKVPKEKRLVNCKWVFKKNVGIQGVEETRRWSTSGDKRSFGCYEVCQERSFVYPPRFNCDRFCGNNISFRAIKIRPDQVVAHAACASE